MKHYHPSRLVQAAQAVAPPEAEWVTIEGVRLIEVGTFPLSTGLTTFTFEDLADAVKAAEEDPSVSKPRLKLGHVEGEGWQAGEPSFGNFFNLRLANNGLAIEADMETVKWLAEIMPIAYPNRSIEGKFGYDAPSGRQYRFVIEAVALLGVELPGVTTLEDLRELYDNPEVNIVTTAVLKAARATVNVHAQVDAEDVRRAFMEQVAQGDRYWWFPRSMQLDPNELIAVDDDSGDLYKIPFTISGRTISFGDPTPVYVQYVDDEEKAKEEEQKTAASVVRYTKAASRRNRVRQEVTMNPEELRAQLGLAADATDEEVTAAIAAGQAAIQAAASSSTEEESTEGEESTEEESTEGQVAVTATAGQGVTLDPVAFAQMQEDARAGREARNEQLRTSREGFVDAAIQAGKFPPARRGHYLKLMAKDDKGTREFINSLEENVIPVVEAGAASSEETLGNDSDTYPDAWLTESERQRISAARGG